MISIAMATYNGAKYLALQLESILAQTISDIELVICDDCSSDGTWELLQTYASKDVRIRCYRNESNLGFVKNFEKAIALCQGDFIALCDQDDIWEKNHLEVLKIMIGDYDIACGDARLIDGNGNDLHKTLSESNNFFKCPATDKIAYRIFYSNGCFQGASMLIKKTFMQKALPFPNDVKYHDVWLSALACFTNGLKYTSTIINNHRRHDSNASFGPTWTKLLGFIHYKKQGNFQKDRIFLAKNIMERCKGSLTPTQVKFLSHIEIYVINKMTKIGKIKNHLFRLIHYRNIYTTTSKIFFERDKKIKY